VLTSDAASGPWPIFDALHAGVPVIALPVGWAVGLLVDGRCGRLAANADDLAKAVVDAIAVRSPWRQRRAELSRRVAPQSFDPWCRANLEMAADLARQAARHET
jgi:glycosyltransferase involved in cell wall biosynthesis